MKKLFLILFFGCVKSPCLVVVDVAFKNEMEISATAVKKIKCGDYITFPYNAATKSPAFIEINFFEGQRVVMADAIFDFDFKDGVFKWEYKFYDTDPDLMVWRVFDIDRTFVEYKTIIQ